MDTVPITKARSAHYLWLGRSHMLHHVVGAQKKIISIGTAAMIHSVYLHTIVNTRTQAQLVGIVSCLARANECVQSPVLTAEAVFLEVVVVVLVVVVVVVIVAILLLLIVVVVLVLVVKIRLKVN